MAAEKASSSFDHRHRFVVAFVYDIPFAEQSTGWAHAVFAQWRASGDFTAQSGVLLTVNISSDQANIGAGPAQRPNISGDPNSGPKTPDHWFNTGDPFFADPVHIRERTAKCRHRTWLD